MTNTSPDLTIPGPACYPHPMPSLNIRKVGDGPRCYAVWLYSWPVFLDGLDGLPHIGDRYEIFGELWRVRRGERQGRPHAGAVVATPAAPPMDGLSRVAAKCGRATTSCLSIEDTTIG